MTKRNVFFGGILVLSIVAFAAVAFADNDGDDSPMVGPAYGSCAMVAPGYSDYGMMGPVYGGGYRTHWIDGYGYDGHDFLTGQQRAAINASQKKFDQETLQLRSKLDAKQFDLHNEFMKNTPDQDKVFHLQKEISNLQSKLEKMTVKHELAVRKMMPKDARAQHYDTWTGYRGGYCG